MTKHSGTEHTLKAYNITQQVGLVTRNGKTLRTRVQNINTQ